MKFLLAALAAALEAIGVLLSSVVLLAIPVFIIWLTQFQAQGNLAQPFSVIAMLWLLGHGVPLNFEISADQAKSLGAGAEAVQLPLGLPLLAIAVFTVFLAVWAGGRVAGSAAASPDAKKRLFAVATVSSWLVFSGITALLAWVSKTYTGHNSLLIFAKPLLVFAVSWLAGAAWQARRELVRAYDRATVARFKSGSDAGRQLSGLLAALRCSPRLFAAVICAFFGLAALGVAVSTLLHFTEFVRISQGLHFDWTGVVAASFLYLLLLPVAIIWSLAWFSGAGFSIGVGSAVSPFEQLLGPVPALPVFSLVPHSWGSWGLLAPCILVALAAVVGFFLAPGLRDILPLQRGVSIVFAAVLCGCAAAICSLFASGPIGSDRLVHTGPGVWQTAGLVSLEAAIGLGLGVWLRKTQAFTGNETSVTGVAALPSLGLENLSKSAEAKDDQETELISSTGFITESELDFTRDSAEENWEPLTPKTAEETALAELPELLPETETTKVADLGFLDISASEPENEPAVEPENEPGADKKPGVFKQLFGKFAQKAEEITEKITVKSDKKDEKAARKTEKAAAKAVKKRAKNVASSGETEEDIDATTPLKLDSLTELDHLTQAEKRRTDDS
ncbi:MAG: DUF6350 family protein [Microbacteriaceae bacterium]|nr:DUF6350 family protein [Microbacteriaceae bacterium]